MVWRVYNLASAAITGAIAVPLFVLWICGLCLARRRGDPARTGFRYLHAVMFIEFLALIFNTTSESMYVAMGVIRDSRSYSRQTYSDLNDARNRIYLVRTLFSIAATALALVLFAELGNGFAFARKGARDGLQKAVRYTAVVAAAIFFVIGLAYFGLYNAALSSFPVSGRTPSSYFTQIRDSQLLLGSFNVLVWVASIALLVQAAMVVHKTRHQPFLRNSAVLYLVAVILFFIRHLYSLVISALYLLNFNIYYSEPAPPYLDVIDAIFFELLFFVSLVLIVSMGFRKNSGLMSTDQARSGYVPNQMYTAQPQQSYYPQQQQPQMQQGWQYPQGQPQQYYVPSQYPAVEQPVQQRKPEERLA